MKKITSIIGLILAFATVNASAQFISPPARFSALTNILALTVEGSMTTNLSAKASQFSIGANGFGVVINASGTNSATTTNNFIRFDLSADGDNWLSNAITVASAPTGTTWVPTYTNLLATGANLGNLRIGRIASIQNTNLASLFVTNITITTR